MFVLCPTIRPASIYILCEPRIMAGGGSQQSLRKYLGALKDTTTVSLAKVNSDYKVGVFYL
jgi:hypothetical protein